MRALLAITIAAAMVGCGGQNTPSPPPALAATASPTADATAEPIGAALSELCHDVNKDAAEYDRRVDELASAEKYDELAVYLRAQLEKAEKFDEQVEALEPPAEERVAFRQYVEANQRLRRLLADLAAAVSVRDFGEMQKVSTTAEQVSQARVEAALQLGADECGS